MGRVAISIKALPSFQVITGLLWQITFTVYRFDQREVFLLSLRRAFPGLYSVYTRHVPADWHEYIGRQKKETTESE